ncbi:SAM-dependent methyltransferase [Inhella inkyongensis]|uniref:SAM-dependent methyltransferase n=1 Tax=Inhella inkyongensis TaxID=392593 RepID=A0A840SBL5_9BURK|nr:class I SAM-dependent methyltransferase [Inhella inkyongensis]MBB5206396.1 SAM-dependent methyltransferase [Inhella inkyongensis]
MAIETRAYASYEDYIRHQKSKADHGTPLYTKLLTDLWEPDCAGFRENFRPYKEILAGCSNALCLGARTGQEVHVLREMGVSGALGIDLVATPPLVLEGDVHQLQFTDASYDFVFSNIFDHVLYPDRFVAEIKRVTRPGAHILLHLSVAPEGLPHPDNDQWAANTLRDSRDVVALFGPGYQVIEDRLLAQANWPTYWTLFLRKE